MRRRAFMTLLAGAAVAWPRAVAAQASGRVWRIGVLITPGERDSEARARVAAFRRGLEALGWKEGENLHVDYRWGGGDDERIRAYAAELVGMGPSVIVANGTPAVAALHEATRSIPVVFALVIDPVGSGYVASMARPGGNATGFTFIELSLTGKWVEMVKAVAPATSRAALIHNPATTPYYAGYLSGAAAARVAGSPAVVDTPVRSAGDVEAVVAEVAREPGGSLLVPPDPFNVVHLERLAHLAQRFGLPAVSVYRRFASYGGLMAYGPDTLDIFRRAASYVDRILGGADPAELPVQAPTRFELVVNRKTADVLGLTIPPLLLVQADEVIE